MQAGGNQRQLPLLFGGQLFNRRLYFCHRAHPCKLSDYLLSGKDAERPKRSEAYACTCQF